MKSSVPMLPEIGVLAFVPDRWGPVWQVRHHVLTRLAAYFHVAWIEPSTPWRTAMKPSHLSRIRRDVSAEVPDGLSICSPENWLPEFHRPAAIGEFVYKIRVWRARQLLVRKGCKKVILYIWRPEFGAALSATPFDLSVYHIDDEYSFGTPDASFDEQEDWLIRAADHVFVHSPGLLEKKGFINSDTTVSPNGVDFQAYSKPVPEPPDLSSIPRPRIGYTGYLKNQLDWELIERLIQERADWHFVFVGPISAHAEARSAVQRLSDLPNVHFLGAKSVSELPAYPQYFDVCIMPYRRYEYTQYIYPLKLHEYLASGTPTVGSRIRSLEDFDGLISLADTAAEWAAEISLSLDPTANSLERREQRQNVARRHDWDVLVAQIARTMTGHLGPAYVERLGANLSQATPEI